jgi:hypothetical protein
LEIIFIHTLEIGTSQGLWGRRRLGRQRVHQRNVDVYAYMGTVTNVTRASKGYLCDGVMHVTVTFLCTFA